MLIGSIREVEAYPRGDYKELLDLIEAYIGLNEGRFQFLVCGTVHKARWMEKQLYCYEMAKLQEYILQGIASKSQLQKISRFLDFFTFIFKSWWFNCPLAASPPHQVLELVNNIKSFANVDPVVSAAALKVPVKAIFHFCTFGGFTSRSCYVEEISILFLPNRFSIFRKLLYFRNSSHLDHS